jgi:hypothetical protein
MVRNPEIDHEHVHHRAGREAAAAASQNDVIAGGMRDATMA